MMYFLRVWITIAVLGPILFWTPSALQQSDLKGGLSFIPIIFVSALLGIALATPTMVLFYLANDYFSKRSIMAWKSKSILALLLIFGTLATFVVIDTSLFESFTNFTFPCS